MTTRLDVALVARRMVPSRAAAQRAIREGRVRVVGVPDPKPATPIAAGTAIAVDGDATRYVGRGGEKLAHALDRFGIDVTGLAAIDVGASTGGFTDCLLQRGAARVVAVDVGTAQLHPRLRTDPRVEVHEQCDIRAFSAAPRYDLVVADVSFVSLRPLAPALAQLGAAGGHWVLLVKPQFEIGRFGRDRRGVVVDPALRADAVGGVIDAFARRGLGLRGVTPSPKTGGAGNVEFLLWLRRTREVAHVTAGDEDGCDG